jgi:hypothetical protein
MNAGTRTLLVTCIAFAGLSAVTSAAAQSVYSWKDDKGVTHYSDSPPPKGATTKGAPTMRVVTPPTPTTPAPATVVAKAKTDAARAGEKPADAAAAAKPEPPQPDPRAVAAARAENCKTAQANLAMLNSAAAVGVDKDGDGKTDEVFNTEQRTAQAQNMQAAVTANCAP